MNDEHVHSLGAYIRDIRTRHGETIRTLAAEAGVDSSGLSRLEHGTAGMPRPDTLYALAPALGVSPADLFAMAGYTVPSDLPDVEAYLRTKYDCLTDDERQAIATLVTAIAKVHGANVPER